VKARLAKEKEARQIKAAGEIEAVYRVGGHPKCTT